MVGMLSAVGEIGVMLRKNSRILLIVVDIVNVGDDVIVSASVSMQGRVGSAAFVA